MTSPKPLHPAWTFSAMIPSAKQKKCSFTDPELFSLQDNLPRSKPSRESSAFKKQVKTQIQVQKQQRCCDLAITHTLSNCYCASLWEEENDRWPREQKGKKNLNLRHGITMLTGEGCQEALRHT